MEHRSLVTSELTAVTKPQSLTHESRIARRQHYRHFRSLSILLKTNKMPGTMFTYMKNFNSDRERCHKRYSKHGINVAAVVVRASYAV